MKDFESHLDAESVRATALDYAEGWYTGNTGRMRRSLHPALVKRSITPSSEGGYEIGPTSTCDMMASWTESGEGRAWTGPRQFEVEILSIFRDIAAVRCLSPEYVDYLQVARLNRGEWKIINVLWQLREGDYVPGV